MTNQYSKKKPPKKGDPDFATCCTVSLPTIYWDALKTLYPHSDRSKSVRFELEADEDFMRHLKILREAGV